MVKPPKRFARTRSIAAKDSIQGGGLQAPVLWEPVGIRYGSKIVAGKTCCWERSPRVVLKFQLRSERRKHFSIY